MNKDILTLICPDWHTSALVLDFDQGRVEYVNWRCLRLLEFHDFVEIDGGRLRFARPEMNERFNHALGDAVANGLEATTLVGEQSDGDGKLSVTIRNPQGLFREILEQHFAGASRLVVVEFATGTMVPEHSAFAALSQAFLLTRREAALVEQLFLGSSLGDLAARPGSSTEAVKRQMSAVLAKTRCSQPADLVKLVMSLCPLEPAPVPGRPTNGMVPQDRSVSPTGWSSAASGETAESTHDGTTTPAGVGA